MSRYTVMCPLNGGGGSRTRVQAWIPKSLSASLVYLGVPWLTSLTGILGTPVACGLPLRAALHPFPFEWQSPCFIYVSVAQLTGEGEQRRAYAAIKKGSSVLVLILIDASIQFHQTCRNHDTPKLSNNSVDFYR